MIVFCTEKPTIYWPELPPQPQMEIEQYVSLIQYNTSLLETYRKLWDELHSQHTPTQKWFDNWIKRIPNIECGCVAWLLKYVKDNPPQFDNWGVYTWTLHNKVTNKIYPERPDFTWSEFESKYPSLKGKTCHS